MSSRIAGVLALTFGLGVLVAAPAQADEQGGSLKPGNLLVSESTYARPDITPGVTQLPPGCATAPIGKCASAIADGTFPIAFNNTSVDSFFGVTSPVFLAELTP